MKEIYVSNLDKSTNKKKLEIMFDVHSPLNIRKIGNSALIDFIDPQAATRAIAALKSQYSITLAMPRWYRDETKQLLQLQTGRHYELNPPTSNKKLIKLLKFLV